jgi:hypothetical protein
VRKLDYGALCPDDLYGEAMTENLTAAEALYSAIGLTKGTDWKVGRADDGTPLAMPCTPEAADRIDTASSAATE